VLKITDDVINVLKKLTIKVSKGYIYNKCSNCGDLIRTRKPLDRFLIASLVNNDIALCTECDSDSSWVKIENKIDATDYNYDIKKIVNELNYNFMIEEKYYEYIYDIIYNVIIIHNISKNINDVIFSMYYDILKILEHTEGFNINKYIEILKKCNHNINKSKLIKTCNYLYRNNIIKKPKIISLDKLFELYHESLEIECNISMDILNKIANYIDNYEIYSLDHPSIILGKIIYDQCNMNGYIIDHKILSKLLGIHEIHLLS